jgi:hypothetical protein
MLVAEKKQIEQKKSSPAENDWKAPLAVATVLTGFLAAFLVHEHYPFVGIKGSGYNYFLDLAHSFLSGRLDLDLSPTIRDVSPFHGKVYAYWPPLCAMILMPFVAMFGQNIGDRWVSVFIVGLGSYAAYCAARSTAQMYGAKPSRSFCAAMAAFFALGTSNLWLSLEGSHWYMAQLTSSCVLMVSIALALSAGSWRFASAGLFWGFSILSRSTTVLAFPFFAYCLGKSAIEDNGGQFLKSAKTFFGRAFQVAAPVAAACLFLAWYNYTRFGSVSETGLTYQNMAPRYAPDLAQYGCFSAHYVLHNIYYELLRLPFFAYIPGIHEDGPFTHFTEGYSLFFQSPLLLYAFLTLRQLKKDRFVQVLWLSVILISVPIFISVGTGFRQWGARYLMDFLPLLFLLAAIGMKGKLTRWSVILTTASIVCNVVGLYMLRHYSVIE